MTKDKRDYFLKLEHDFFINNTYIKKLEKMEDGAELALLYLKLLTHSLKDDGILFFRGIEENFEEELALDLDEDSDLVRRLIDFLTKNKLLIEQVDNTYRLEQILEIGHDGYYSNI